MNLLLKLKKKLLQKKPLIKIIFVVFPIVCMASVLVWLFWDLPLPTKLTKEPPPVSTKIFDRNDKLIYEIYATKRRSPVSLSEIPENVKKATIAIEDKDFYSHHGFSVSGMARAIYKITFRQKLEGGSTLTQQLVKSSLLTQDRTLKRKVREFVLSLAVEFLYSKDEILEMYLNQIPYGSTAYGIESASELYFGKKVSDLNLAESALLAGLTAAPTAYSPFGSSPQKAIARQKLVLDRMQIEGFISEEDKNKALEEKLVFAERVPQKATHFVLWLKEQLAEKYGDKLVEQGGLRVKTTLDIDLQEISEKAVLDEVSKLSKQKVKNGASLVIKPKSGEILAFVGSKDYFATDEDGKVNILVSNRQPGSSIKPLNYALAIRDGKITASTALADVPTCFIVFGQESYCPKNYTGNFTGLSQVRFALGNSLNIPAVRVLALNGLENFVTFARDMGIDSFVDPKNYGLSLTLGGGEVKPLEMAQAFSVFANQGVRIPLNPVLEITDWKGKTYEKRETKDIEGDRILPPEVTYIISHILLDNGARAGAFGTSSYLNVSGHPEVSVKTGTTNDRRDNWTIGYTEDILTLAWVGNNDNTPMGGAVSGVSGASPIWNIIMKSALSKYEVNSHAWPKQPDGVIGKTVCSNTGYLALEGEDPNCPKRFEFFIKEYLPSVYVPLNMDVLIDKTTQSLADNKLPEDQKEPQNKPMYKDPLGTMYCLTCPLPTWYTSVKYPL